MSVVSGRVVVGLFMTPSRWRLSQSGKTNKANGPPWIPRNSETSKSLAVSVWDLTFDKRVSEGEEIKVFLLDHMRPAKNIDFLTFYNWTIIQPETLDLIDNISISQCENAQTIFQP